MSDEVTIKVSTPDREISFSCRPKDSFAITRRGDRIEIWRSGIWVVEHIIGEVDVQGA